MTDSVADSRATSTPPPPQAVPLSGTGRSMARRMEHAWTAPAFTLVVELEVDGLDRARAGHQGVSLTDVLLMRCAHALVAHPQLNAHYHADAYSVTRFETASIGIAVATRRGLLVPVLRDVDRLPLDEIAAGRRELVDRARGGQLSMAEMQGGTFTLSNLGMFGVTHFTALLNPPQVAILAVGKVRTQLAMAAGTIAELRVMTLTLTCDHRAVDGATGASFLRDISVAPALADQGAPGNVLGEE
jgi:pyruvate dehydrogenase E2 component (dihydrolipoamide acetyltransferase)